VVFVHANHSSENIIKGVSGLGSTIIVASEGIAEELRTDAEATRFRVSDNLDLVTAVSRHLSVDDTTIARGIESAHHDKGRAELFKLKRNDKTVWFANTFAANDPVSTSIIIGIILRDAGLKPTSVAGILSLRNDRSERTGQWIKHLKSEKSGLFSQVYITGGHRQLAGRQLKGSSVLTFNDPQEITNHIFNNSHDKTVVFGLANIAGTGNRLAEYWRRELEWAMN
jgi:UDP-N-acetylmuramyl pentapeptide synthase